MSMPRLPAMPAISRLELVPISVIEPASVVRCAIGSIISLAGIDRVCSSCLLAGISMATIGVVFIRPEATPTGAASRRSACGALVTVSSSLRVTRATTPVCTTPLAITSMAPTVITPPLLRPENSSRAGAMPSSPAITIADPRATTGRTQPAVITTRVATTRTAATTITCHPRPRRVPTIRRTRRHPPVTSGRHNPTVLRAA